MPGGKGKIRPKDGKQFSSEYQPQEEIWTEDVAILFLTDLLNWLFEDKTNMFYEEFIFMVADPLKYDKRAKIYTGLTSYLSKKYTSCFNLLEKAKKIQEIKLKKYGTADNLNATITKFVLINEHGWKDKQDIEHSGGVTLNFGEDYKKL